MMRKPYAKAMLQRRLLRRVKFHHFGAFFCLEYRQNDYISGDVCMPLSV